GEELEGCSGKYPKDDPNTSLYSIDVIQVPLAAPEKAHIVNRPRVFADATTGALAGLWQGRNHGEGTQTTAPSSRCHDITVFPEIGLAAGGGARDGILSFIFYPPQPGRPPPRSPQELAFYPSSPLHNPTDKDH